MKNIDGIYLMPLHRIATVPTTRPEHRGAPPSKQRRTRAPCGQFLDLLFDVPPLAPLLFALPTKR
jgi:hypothetical protein